MEQQNLRKEKKLTSSAFEALKGIIADSTSLSDLINQLAVSSEEINKSIENITHVTRNNSLLTIEINGTVEKLIQYYQQFSGYS